MKPTLTKGIIGIATSTTLIMGGVDASVLNEKPLNRVETVANERVEAKQIGNKVDIDLSWKDQPTQKISYDMGKPSVSEKLADKRKVEVYTQKKTVTEMEIGLILNEIPNQNTFCWNIDTTNYNWYKQPPLTQQEIDNGASRTDNVINSFAVYNATKKNHIEGQTNYETGKAFHRYRAQATDTNDNTIWADDSNVVNGQVCDTFSNKWLSQAVYPIKI